MKKVGAFELPADLEKVMQKAKKLEWITIGYLITSITLMFLVLGSSQAMKTAWVESIFALIPSFVFLIATKIYTKAPNASFLFGYHRVFSIAFLAGSVALFGIGIFLFVDSLMSLLKAEHPTIGSVELMGNQIWMGWILILVLIYDAVPSFFLGKKKIRPALKLHNRVLYTDAVAQKADYTTDAAAIIGIIGIGLGWWWADAGAAILISFSVLKDGYNHSKNAILDLMGQYPLQIKNNKKEPLVEEVKAFVKSWPNVEDVNVRFHPQGQVLFGEVAVIFKPGTHIADAVEEGIERIKDFNWRVYDVSIIPVRSLPQW